MEQENVISAMEDTLGIKKEAAASDETQNTTAPKEGDNVEPHPSDKKEEETPPSDDEKASQQSEHKPDTTVLTQEQIQINKEITKREVEIETLKSASVDLDSFYENIENELSEEEAALEFSDKPAYMKLVNERANAYVEKNSNSEEIKKLEEQNADAQIAFDTQSAITAVTSKYPEYDHEKIASFFSEDLTQNEQKKITSASTSFADVYEKTYLEYIAKNPQNIATTPAPNIPDVNSARKQPTQTKDIDDGLKSEDEQLQEALGL